MIGSIGKELSVNDMAIFNPNNFTKNENGMEGKFVLVDIMLQNTIII